VLGTPADDLVHALKYEGWRELAEPMGDAVSRLLPRVPGAGEGRRVVVPVPTTSERARARGYNQAEALACRVAAVSGLPLIAALERVGRQASQTVLRPDERRANVRGVFRPTPVGSGPVRGARVLLIDDVLTTGATACEAATVLSGMGAETVTLLTFARALGMPPAKPGQALS
jgi:ComF family protein